MPSSRWLRSASAPILLTTGNANLLMVHGTEAQKEVFAERVLGRFSGTMCLSEPQAGSS
jgi:alkylation response protein AidB-like acyl-CoA dehydrogenase